MARENSSACGVHANAAPPPRLRAPRSRVHLAVEDHLAVLDAQDERALDRVAAAAGVANSARRAGVLDSPAQTRPNRLRVGLALRSHARQQQSDGIVGERGDVVVRSVIGVAKAL